MNFIYIIDQKTRNHQKSEHGEQGENKANYLSSACSGPYERQVVEIVLIYTVIMVIYAFLDDVYGHMFQLVYKFVLLFALHQILFGFVLSLCTNNYKSLHCYILFNHILLHYSNIQNVPYLINASAFETCMTKFCYILNKENNFFQHIK